MMHAGHPGPGDAPLRHESDRGRCPRPRHRDRRPHGQPGGSARRRPTELPRLRLEQEDLLVQSQPETRANVAFQLQWLAPTGLDMHGYVSPTLIDGLTKPHNPGIEYDLFAKWNQRRLDANEAAFADVGMDVLRPVNDWDAGAKGGPPPVGPRTRRAGTTGARSTSRPIWPSGAWTARRWRCATATRAATAGSGRSGPSTWASTPRPTSGSRTAPTFSTTSCRSSVGAWRTPTG